VDILREIAEFFKHESCGKCTPCREGTMRIAEIMEKLAGGEGTQKDIDLIKTLSAYMQKTCFCPLGQSATTAFISALKLFPEDFDAKIKKEA
ncbi:MAG: NADH-quinone oxidoreductase subunit F, partial [Oscillospiraceae bacterium]|nr:NADH-quinone oxidoreductase subunit F [Oscillospiraceae bacterium]